MHSLPDALAPLAAYKQFVLYKLVPSKKQSGKMDKLPVDCKTTNVDNAHNPAIWVDADTAINTAHLFGDDYGVGFVFTVNDPFFFVDIDECLQSDGTWSPIANDVLARLPGAAVEISQSGRGLHIIGQGIAPDHACKNTTLHLEYYTDSRFVALTGTNAIGSAATDCSAMLPAMTAELFPPKTATKDQTWTTAPVPEWNGTEDNDELLAKARATKSAAATFGNTASFDDLWTGNQDALAAAYSPDSSDSGNHDESSADAALAQHLAFWTGNNCERILNLMWCSGLIRDKWNRPDYLIRTITRAVSMQEVVYTGGSANDPIVDDPIAIQFGAAKLKGSDGQIKWASNIRAQKLIECAGEESLILKLCASHGSVITASFWINNRSETVEALIEMVTAIDSAGQPLGNIDGPEILAGYQFLGATQQIEHFKGCVYIQDQHRVFTPNGSLLKSEQFNATYGGYSFQLEGDASGKTTRKAWEAFTESQAVRYPKAESMCFRPELEPGALVAQEGHILVNTYVPIETPRQVGDATPFLTHLAKILPNQGDQSILLAYMAACIQHKGVKFQWAPLLQGVEGNGKTLFTRCVAFAIGDRYVHMPPAHEISEKFNAWLFNTLFIGVEDIYVPDQKREVIEIIKPMITNDRLARRAMQTDQKMHDTRCNFMFNSNHKDAVRKTRNDRRFCVFYTAQQSHSDIERDGMSGDYFPDIYKWLRGGGYAIVADFLTSYLIPDALNPATACHRAPETSSTDEAITASMGGVEQEIIEAIDEGRPGFAGGWISSKAIQRILESMHMTRAIPHNKRRELLQSLGYDWHPALHEGRVNNFIALDEGKPKLFIKNGHVHCNLTTAGAVVKAYQESQGILASTNTKTAGEVFR